MNTLAEQLRGYGGNGPRQEPYLDGHPSGAPGDGPMPGTDTAIRPRGDQIRDAAAAAYHANVQTEIELMAQICEVERTKLYLDDGEESTPHWISMTFGRGYMRSCELYEVALTLQECPHLLFAYAHGELSYDHLRALCQVAGPESEQALYEAAKDLTVKDTFALVDKIKGLSKEDSACLHAERWLELSWDRSAGVLYINGRLPEELGVKVEKALDEVARALPDEPDEDCIGGKLPMGTKRVDALVELTTGKADTQGTVVIHTTPFDLASEEGIAELEGGPVVTSETARRIVCDGKMVEVTHDQQGTPISVGQTTRSVPLRLKRELIRRDKGCRFPGCHYRKGVHAHHIVPVSKGGPTDLANLVLMCAFHHRYIHDNDCVVMGEPPNVLIARPGMAPIAHGPPKRG
jgi:hypothetical protein